MLQIDRKHQQHLLSERLREPSCLSGFERRSDSGSPSLLIETWTQRLKCEEKKKSCQSARSEYCPQFLMAQASSHCGHKVHRHSILFYLASKRAVLKFFTGIRPTLKLAQEDMEKPA